jgi:D-alanyl-D-alanine dipeptidase
MKLEYDILHYLNSHDNGRTVDVTFIEDDYEAIRETLNDLKGRNMIVLEHNSFRDFEAFGISNQRKRLLKAKINTNGKIRLHELRNSVDGEKKKEKRFWKLSYLFNF